MYVIIITTGIYIHKLLHFANHFMSHLFFFSVISLLLNASIKNDGNYFIFKLKNHLIQLNRTYKIDCLLLDTDYY